MILYYHKKKVENNEKSNKKRLNSGLRSNNPNITITISPNIFRTENCGNRNILFDIKYSSSPTE